MTTATTSRPATALSPRLTTATAARALRQLRHDHRTVAMLLVLPSALLGLLYLIWADVPTGPGQADTFDRIGLTMLGIFPFVVMFLVTSIAMLRERTSGTLERLLPPPLSRPDLLLGYGAAFGLAAALQAVVTVAVAATVYDLAVAGPLALVVLIAVVDAVLGVALGLLAKAVPRSAFQAVQFMPVVVLPQFFLCGLLVPREQLAGWLQGVSDVLPLTYAVDALREVGSSTEATGTMWVDVGVVAGAALLALGLAAATLRRRTSGPTPPAVPGPPAGAPATPTPGRRCSPRRAPPSPSAGSTAPRSGSSPPPRGSTRRWCTTTSAARTSSSSPPSRRRPTPTSCCPRCS